MRKTDAVKLIIALGLLAVAGTIYVVRGSSGQDAPSDDTTKTAWFCTACNEGFELTPAELAAGTVKSDYQEPEAGEEAGGEPSALGRQSRRLLKTATCPKCGDNSAVAARKCPECQCIFAGATKLGKAAICPGCKWDPLTGRTAESYRVEEGL